MAIERITDSNYEHFGSLPRGILVVGTSWCEQCKKYEPIIETLSRQNPFIGFGKTVIDTDRSSQLKRDYRDINQWIFPTTLLFENQREVARIRGFSPYPIVRELINNNLILGSTIFLKSNNGKYFPAVIKQINKSNGLYSVQLSEDSFLGRRGSEIQISEGNFNWNLE